MQQVVQEASLISITIVKRRDKPLGRPTENVDRRSAPGGICQAQCPSKDFDATIEFSLTTPLAGARFLIHARASAKIQLRIERLTGNVRPTQK